jgi:hypothetical protein
MLAGGEEVGRYDALDSSARIFPLSVSQCDRLRCLIDYDRWRLDASAEVEVRYASSLFMALGSSGQSHHRACTEPGRAVASPPRGR